MIIFIDDFFHGWFSSESCVDFFLQLLGYRIDLVWTFDKDGGDFRMDNGNFRFFFFSFDEFLPPILIYIRLSLLDVFLESSRRDCGYYGLFFVPPCNCFLQRWFVDGRNGDASFFLPSLIPHIVFLCYFSGSLWHLNLPGFPIDRRVVFLEPRKSKNNVRRSYIADKQSFKIELSIYFCADPCEVSDFPYFVFGSIYIFGDDRIS